MARNIVLKSFLSPGDTMTLTAAVESLHLSYPGQFNTDVRCTAKELFENNPWISDLSHVGHEPIDCEYPLIHKSNNIHCSFLEGYTRHLGSALGINLSLAVNKPMIYLRINEKSWISQVHQITGKKTRYWLVNAGVKSDFTAKQWPIEYYQSVIDATRHKIQWVQVGSSDHGHVRLSGVIDLVGATNHRQFARLVYNSCGGIGPVTYLQHMCAAFSKPYMCILGGREPVTWVSYPCQHTFHSIGALDCCADKACWKSRIVPLNDGDEKDKSICDNPMVSFRSPVGKCMSLIRPEEVVATIERYL